MRRGWVTFAREVNIKDICWKLNTTKVNACKLYIFGSKF